jgi:hypothetical protein
MAPRTTILLALFTEGRTRFTKLLAVLTEADLSTKLAPSPNSIGFLCGTSVMWNCSSQRTCSG